ncbi:hypothetical protein NOF04DRAFT_1279617 [Fusarium oxysporum II5]|nr:hypothetical protein DER44DRAFT_740285 [Fusarium oxysporum]KAK2126076.1 hypothetical protein NOF04DRAFT_1279617 [Fusarium oxysporum II5]
MCQRIMTKVIMNTRSIQSNLSEKRTGKDGFHSVDDVMNSGTSSKNKNRNFYDKPKPNGSSRKIARQRFEYSSLREGNQDEMIRDLGVILRPQAIESLKVTRNVGVTTLNRQAEILEIEARKHSASNIVVKTISSSGERASLSQPGPTDSPSHTP